MKRACAIALLAAPAAWAALPGLPTGFTVRVVDESGRAVPEAFVVAREFASVPQLHGSRTYCVRGDVVRVSSGEGAARLPAAGMGHLAPGRTYALEAFAYVTGQCVQRTGSARAAAHLLSVPYGIRSSDPPRTVQAGETATLRSIPMAGGEERLEYLVNLSLGLACESWSARSKPEVARLEAAMRGEARLLARDSAYARSLARRLEDQLAAVRRLDAPATQPTPAMAMPAATAPPRNFLVAPANVRLHWPASDGAMVVMSANRGAGDFGLTIHCRPGSACDLDERDAQGQTALYQYAEAFDLDRFRLLLDRGADPSVAVDRHGSNAIDALLQRAVVRPPALGSIDSDKARAIIDLIAASPKAVIRARLAEDLASDPAQWFAKSPEALAVLTHARARLAGLARRADGAGTCERIEEPSSDRGALRLR